MIAKPEFFIGLAYTISLIILLGFSYGVLHNRNRFQKKYIKQYRSQQRRRLQVQEIGGKHDNK